MFYNVCILQVTVFMSRTFNRRQGLIAGCVVAAVHLLFLLYLHFAYHSVYEGQYHALLHGRVISWATMVCSSNRVIFVEKLNLVLQVFYYKCLKHLVTVANERNMLNFKQDIISC